MLLGVDVGGTFTDAVLGDAGRLVTAKAPTTPGDEAEGVMAAVATALDRAGARPADVRVFAHGTTTVTNALLEGDAAPTALLVTEGFTDVVELGRQARPELYRLCAAPPPPLVPPERRLAVPERTGPDGVLRPLTEAAADGLAERVEALGVEAAAVVLLHGYRHPGHERRLGAALRRRLPDLHVSLSHEVTGTVREFERAATTEIDAALSPLLGRYLRRLGRRAREAGLPPPAIMQSNGGLVAADRAAGHAAWTVLSGPAGGAAGAAFAARAAGEADAVCFDLGGTSCDVCLVRDGAVAEATGRTVAGRPVSLPVLDLHTVGAGGGSIAWADAGGALRAGPRSAGARPGPACYGRGGTEPTVTDANLLLGRLPAGGALAGGVRLDRGAAEAAVGRLAGRLGLDLLRCAEGIVRVADAEMVRALRVVTVERGVDPRGLALVAFGGGGALHAATIAGELGMDRVLVPRASGVLAALGLVVGERRRDAQRSVVRALDDLGADGLGSLLDELGEVAAGELGEPDAERRRVVELRERGQAFELAIPVDGTADPGRLAEAFAAAHEERYGFRPGRAVELVTARVTASVPGAGLDLAALAPAGADVGRGERDVVVAGERVRAAVLRGEPPPGTTAAGPAVLELPETTVLVPPGWRAEVDRAGAVRLRREGGAA